MSQPIVIFGPGGHGREVLQIIRDQNRLRPVWDCQGFLADPDYPAPDSAHGLPVLGGIEWLRDRPDTQVVVAIGAPADRRRIARRIESEYGAPFATLIHPLAWLGENVVTGAGVVIFAGALLTTDIRLGSHTHINLGATISHDTDIGDYVTISPGVNIAGRARIEEGVFIGVGARVIPGATVGPWSILGAGAVVTSDIPGDCTAVGTPAKPIKTRPSGWHETTGQGKSR